MPLDVVSQHARQDVGPHPVGQPVMDGTDPQLGRLEAAEGALDLGQPLEVPDRLLAVELLGGDVGAQRVEAVQLGFALDALSGQPEAEAVLADVQFEVLAPEGPLGAGDGLGDPLQLSLGGLDQLLTLAGPPVGRKGVAAHDQPLARKVGAVDLGRPALVEQRQLQMPLLGQAVDAFRPCIDRAPSLRCPPASIGKSPTSAS